MGQTTSKCGGACAAEIGKIVDKYGRDSRNLIPLLHDLQDAMGYISPEAMETVAETLEINVSQVHGVTTFYTMFYTKPAGKYVVRLCDSPPCHIEGSRKVRDIIAKELGIKPGESSGDGSFTFEIVSCMGLCGVAPAMMINDDVYGNLEPEKIPAILARYKASGADASGSSSSRSSKEGR